MSISFSAAASTIMQASTYNCSIPHTDPATGHLDCQLLRLLPFLPPPSQVLFFLYTMPFNFIYQCNYFFFLFINVFSIHPAPLLILSQALDLYHLPLPPCSCGCLLFFCEYTIVICAFLFSLRLLRCCW